MSRIETLVGAAGAGAGAGASCTSVATEGARDLAPTIEVVTAGTAGTLGSACGKISLRVGIFLEDPLLDLTTGEGFELLDTGTTWAPAEDWNTFDSSKESSFATVGGDSSKIPDTFETLLAEIEDRLRL